MSVAGIVGQVDLDRVDGEAHEVGVSLHEQRFEGKFLILCSELKSRLAGHVVAQSDGGGVFLLGRGIRWICAADTARRASFGHVGDWFGQANDVAISLGTVEYALHRL